MGSPRTTRVAASRRRSCLPILTVFLSVIGRASCLFLPLKEDRSSLMGMTRRQQLVETRRRFVVVGGFVVFLATTTGHPDPASAARGAAELDMEFYMRDILGGNKKGGTIHASVIPTAGPPRTLSGRLLPFLLDPNGTSQCAPGRALRELLFVQQQRRSPATAGAIGILLEQEIETRVQDWRDRSRRSFRIRAPWVEEDVTDQYYFDVTSYAVWKTAADLLPEYVDRDTFVRQTGRFIYERMLSEGLVSPLSSSSTKEEGGTGGILTNVLPQTHQVLEAFKKVGFCKDYRIRGDDSSREAADPVFDELDDEGLLAGGTVDCLVSVFEPATLGASLQITGEQSRFGPDYVGCTLAALWDAAGLQSSWETFFVDPEYRPNPKDYFPNEQLLQFTLRKK